MARRRAGHGKIGVQGFAAQRAASTTPADSESGDAESIGTAGHAQARRARRGIRRGRGSARAPPPDRRTAFNAGHCGAGPGRHRCARLCLVERGWAAAVRAAIGGCRAEKRAARGSAGGDRAATGRARRAEERRRGAHGSTTSGGAYYRDHEGGRGGLATRCSAPVLVLEPGDVGLGHRKPTAMGRRRAAAPPPGDRALRIARSAQARGRCASIVGVSAVTTRETIAVAQEVLQRAGIDAVIGQLETAAMAQHVRMNWEGKFGQFPSPADHFEEPGPRHCTFYGKMSNPLYPPLSYELSEARQALAPDTEKTADSSAMISLRTGIIHDCGLVLTKCSLTTTSSRRTISFLKASVRACRASRGDRRGQDACAAQHPATANFLTAPRRREEDRAGRLRVNAPVRHHWQGRR